MPNSMIPEYLTKEDLTFEILCRFEVPTGDLRTQLRTILKKGSSLLLCATTRLTESCAACGSSPNGF